MSLHTAIRGAIAPDVLPFSLYEKRATDFDEYDKMLGKTFRIGNGLAAMLVEASATYTKPTPVGGTCWKWADVDAYTVAVTASGGDEPCGFSLPGLEDLVAGDFFWIVVPTRAGARVSLIDSGSGITAGDYVQGTAAGEVVTDATFDHANPGTSFGIAIETASADAKVDVMLIMGQVGGINA